jgi:hypothetical protein
MAVAAFRCPGGRFRPNTAWHLIPPWHQVPAMAPHVTVERGATNMALGHNIDVASSMGLPVEEITNVVASIQWRGEEMSESTDLWLVSI